MHRASLAPHRRGVDYDVRPIVADYRRKAIGCARPARAPRIRRPAELYSRRKRRGFQIKRVIEEAIRHNLLIIRQRPAGVHFRISYAQRRTISGIEILAAFVSGLRNYFVLHPMLEAGHALSGTGSAEVSQNVPLSHQKKKKSDVDRRPVKKVTRAPRHTRKIHHRPPLAQASLERCARSQPLCNSGLTGFADRSKTREVSVSPL